MTAGKVFQFVNPTGRGLRGSDSWGSGAWLAPRGKRLHLGLDFEAQPDQIILSPLDGVVRRIARPYAYSLDEPANTGLLIEGTGRHADISVKLFYVIPDPGILGSYVTATTPIGLAASLQSLYPSITNHIHLALFHDGDPIDPTPYFFASPASTSA
jgi:hypothetical protein